MLRIRSLALVPVVALVLTACGGATEEEYEEAMTSALSTSPTQPLSEEKAQCVADDFVGRMGVDRLEEGGGIDTFKREASTMTFKSISLTEAEANDLFDDFIDCGADLRGRVIAALGDEELALPEGMMKCLKSAITEDEMRDFFVPMMTDGDATLEPKAQKKMFKDVDTCVTDLIAEQG